MPMKKIICVLLAVVLMLGVMPVKGLSATNADQLTISDNGVSFIKAFEGFSAVPQWDYSQYSIGYGSYCPPDMVDHYTKNPIDEAKATEMLVSELQSKIGYVRTFLKKYDLTVTQGQFDALVSLTYNIGQKWSTSTGYYIHKALAAEQWDPNFIIYSLSLYSTAGGEYLKGLINRRLAEANMFINDVYQKSPTSNMKYIFLDGNGGVVDYRVHGYDANRKSGIYANFSYPAVGPDKNGNIVTYELDGWYTEKVGGTKVEVLDETLVTGSVLYAHWKTPDGDPVTINDGLKLPVTITDAVNIRYGPGTHYAIVDSKNNGKVGEVLTVTQTATANDQRWGRTERGWLSLNYTNYYEAMEAYLPHWAVVTANGVSIRADKGPDAEVIGTKNIGDPVQILEWAHSSVNMWGRCEEGWISLQHVQWADVDPNAEYSVTFKNYDGTVLNTAMYKYGAAVTVPPVPTKPADESGSYIFKGWNRPVTPCFGNMEYTAVFDLLGDVNKSGKVNEDDGIYLLWHVFFADDYPVDTYTDFDGNGKVNEDDAIYLLWHVFYPQDYPLKAN